MPLRFRPEIQKMLREVTENGIRYMSSPLLPVKNVFTTRFGGVSTGEFSSMNLGSNRGDDAEAVRENYTRLCALFGVGPDDACVTKQVHGSDVRIVTSEDRHACMSVTPYEADGIVTGEKGLPLFCFTADCIPVLLADIEGKAAAAVHCGWRSSVADILLHTVEAMESLGARRENICAALGPAIGPCCFETDSDVPEAVEQYVGAEARSRTCVLQSNAKFLVDLRSANRERLLQLGLKPDHIDVSEECTVCSHDKYWSHRYTLKNGLKRGSLAAGIML